MAPEAIMDQSFSTEWRNHWWDREGLGPHQKPTIPPVKALCNYFSLSALMSNICNPFTPIHFWVASCFRTFNNYLRLHWHTNFSKPTTLLTKTEPWKWFFSRSNKTDHWWPHNPLWFFWVMCNVLSRVQLISLLSTPDQGFTYKVLRRTCTMKYHTRFTGPFKGLFPRSLAISTILRTRWMFYILHLK